VSVESAALLGQYAEESRMVDSCVITASGASDPVFNETTGQYDAPAGSTVYDGPCRIPRRGVPASVSTAQAGEAAWQVGEFPLNLPVDTSAAVRVGQTVTYSSDDPALDSQVFGITEVSPQTQATARRCRMKQIVGGGQR
jgi:hypothetical protein